MADQQALYAFSQWVACCGGNEKQEAQTFVQKLLTAWGWQDATEAGVQFEHKIPKGGAGGGMGYADALIPGKVLIEMKQRGEVLGQHFPQLQRYWFNLAPKPTYAILCNFDEFWVYDFNIQVDEPVEQLQTAQLAERWSGLAFLSKAPETPLFGNNQISVTEKQAQAMGHLFHDLKVQATKTEKFSAQQAQRFVLQCVLCMFAEDRGMLPNRQFSLALEDCREKGDSTYDVLGGLFAAMNTPGETPGGRFKGTPYFNGGLFSEIPQIELSPDQLTLLVESAREDWRMVRPSIFGNIFEASSDERTRHALGQHFTSEADILKVVRPTIIEPWEGRIAAAKTIPEYDKLLVELQAYRVLDPACGSGNFLYMAYNGLKDIEAAILGRIQDRRRSEALKVQGAFGFVNTNQFFGMDTDPFAVELARVTLMIARKVAHDRLGLTEQELPLDNLDKNIVEADALFTSWPEADAIIGNPPFLGGKRLKGELGTEYVEMLYKKFPECANFADICCYWFRLAHDRLPPSGSAGLVGTNMIRKGSNRKASLDYISKHGGWIHNAVSDLKWSGEANVHVSIVNWARQPRSCILDGEEVESINTSLKDRIDAGDAGRLEANSGFSFIGAQPTGKGFEISEDIALYWIKEDGSNTDVLRSYITAREIASSPAAMTNKWIIDFNEMALEDAERFRLPFEHIRKTVRPERLANKNTDLHGLWWQHWRPRPAMRNALKGKREMLVVPCHSKWVMPIRAATSALGNNSVTVFACSDYYTHGILSSVAHREWVAATASSLKGDTRYTPSTVFETFPFPQQVTAQQAEAIRQQMIELNAYRNAWMVENQKGITELYNRYFDEPASKLRKLHDALDALVLKAYGWSAKDDVLANLLDLNLELAELESEGKKVVGPWDPTQGQPNRQGT
jgi:type I restriction-modification system DNA methylase subunit